MKIYHYSFSATDGPNKVLHGSSLTPHAETQKHIQRLGQLHCLVAAEDHDQC